ncbi:hypothetical protein [Alienimonas californiensis]|uniref:3-keto-disaccharide hydrolase domain-containing protein n=1 Tax=Alienimonas californiensis TaxID=2527989 RepID=A0A517P439_9PLAN|nr:hypothetical protein [Alienimonas californiensis]QDT14113.1 hypothetical protein CA12_01810 [Alienimonas californiensis]
MLHARTPAKIAQARAAAGRGDGEKRHRMRVWDDRVSMTVNGVDFGQTEGARDPDMLHGRLLRLDVGRKSRIAPQAKVRFRSIQIRPLRPDGTPLIAASAAAAP